MYNLKVPLASAGTHRRRRALARRFARRRLDLRSVEEAAPQRQLWSGQLWPDAHDAVAARTKVALRWRATQTWLTRLVCGCEELTSQSESGSTAAVGQISVLANADETARQDVLDEAAQKLRRR